MLNIYPEPFHCQFHCWAYRLADCTTTSSRGIRKHTKEMHTSLNVIMRILDHQPSCGSLKRFKKGNQRISRVWKLSAREVNAQKPHTHLHFIIILIPAECCKGNVLNNWLKLFDLQRNNFWYLLSCCCFCSSSGMFILDYLHGDGVYFILLKCGVKTPKCLTMRPPFNSFLIYHGAQVRSEKSTSSTSAKSHQNITMNSVREMNQWSTK